MMRAPQVITVILTLAIFLLIYLPIICVNGYKYGLNRHHIVFKKRYANITIIVLVIIVIKLLFQFVSLTVEYLIPPIDNIDILHILFECINSFFQFGILYCWVWRFWLLSYECKLLVYINKNKWQTIINDNYNKTNQNTENHWYLTHKKTFGNYHFCGKYIIIPLILISSVIKIAFFLSAEFLSESDIIKYILIGCVLINYLIPYILLLIIYCFIPKVWDNFYICSELKKICIALIINYISYILGNILTIFFDDRWYWLTYLISINLIFFSQFICILVATRWVNNKLSLIIQNNKFELFNIEESRMPLIAVRSKTVTTFSSNPINTVSLIDILSHHKSFEIFIKHLIAEFCIEILLSLVELIQFQQFIYSQYFRNEKYNHYRLNDDYFHDALFKKINFPETVPKSKIIYNAINNDNDQNINNNLIIPHHTKNVQSYSKSRGTANSKSNIIFSDIIALKEEQEDINDDILNNSQQINDIKEKLKNKSKQLYLKYIAVGSHYEINIAWSLRSKLINLFQNNNNNDNHHENKKKKLNEYKFIDYIDLFDEVCNEMYKLMRDSYDRFRRKNEYQKLKKLIFTV